MTATEELRRMLDERGVEWDYGITGSTTTRFSVNGIELTFTPMRDGLVCSTILTPEQAVAATLGSSNCSNDCTNSERMGTCEQEEGGWSTEGDHARVWLTCGHDCMVETVADLPNFCPVCGTKVVD